MNNVELASSPEKSPSPDDFGRQKASSNADVEKVAVQNSYKQMTEILTIPGMLNIHLLVEYLYSDHTTQSFLFPPY